MHASDASIQHSVKVIISHGLTKSLVHMSAMSVLESLITSETKIKSVTQALSTRRLSLTTNFDRQSQLNFG